MLLNKDDCFKLGANPLLGISAQLGHRTRDPNSVPTDGQPESTSGSLRRLKAEGYLDMPFSCLFSASRKTNARDSHSALSVISADLSSWTLMFAGAAWRDFDERRSYRKYELTLRIPTGANAFMDLKREYGAAPTSFDTGAKFSANLTVLF